MKATDISKADATLIMSALQNGAELSPRMQEATYNLYRLFSDPWRRNENETVEAWCKRCGLTSALADIKAMLEKHVPEFDHFQYVCEPDMDSGETELWVYAYTRSHDVDEVLAQIDVIDRLWVTRPDYLNVVSRLHYIVDFL